MNYQMFLWLGGMAISIISYFLKNTMEELKYYKSMTIETKSKLDLLSLDHENKYKHLNEKIDALYNAIKDLTVEVKEINKKMK